MTIHPKAKWLMLICSTNLSEGGGNQQQKKKALHNHLTLNKYPLRKISLAMVNGSTQKTKQNKSNPHTLSFWHLWTNSPCTHSWTRIPKTSSIQQNHSQWSVGPFQSMLDLQDNFVQVTSKPLNTTSMKSAEHKVGSKKGRHQITRNKPSTQPGTTSHDVLKEDH